MNPNSSQKYRSLVPQNHSVGHSSSKMMKIENGVHTRKIFHTPQLYDDFERSSIREFQLYLTSSMIVETVFDDATYLRFLYSGGFDLFESARRLAIFNEWLSDPDIQILNPNSRSILESGTMYCSGRDHKGHPVIYLNMALTDFTKYTMGEYYCAWNNLTKQVIDEMFIPGKIQTWVIIIETQSKFLLPVHMLEWIVRKLSVVYCHRLEKLYVVNAIPIVRVVYGAIKGFIHEDTQKKIEVLSADEMSKLQEVILEEEMEQKYGGSLQNLEKYWPFQPNRNKQIHKDVRKEYFEPTTVSCTPRQNISRIDSFCESVLNDEAFFYGKKQTEQSAKQPVCCNGCMIF